MDVYLWQASFPSAWPLFARMRILSQTLFLLAVTLPALMLWGGCKRTKYICPAYQSAFVLDMPTYKRSSALDSMAASADTSLDVDVIAVLAERVRKEPTSRYEYDADSVPKFPTIGDIKTNVLLIKRISRRRKDKLMANVPMITVFPVSPDSTQGEEGAPQATPAGDEGVDTAPADREKKDEQPAREAEKKEEDSKPF